MEIQALLFQQPQCHVTKWLQIHTSVNLDHFSTLEKSRHTHLFFRWVFFLVIFSIYIFRKNWPCLSIRLSVTSVYSSLVCCALVFCCCCCCCWDSSLFACVIRQMKSMRCSPVRHPGEIISMTHSNLEALGDRGGGKHTAAAAAVV